MGRLSLVVLLCTVSLYFSNIPTPVMAKSTAKAKSHVEVEAPQAALDQIATEELAAIKEELNGLRAEVQALQAAGEDRDPQLDGRLQTMRIALVIIGAGLGAALFEIRTLKRRASERDGAGV